MAADSQEIHFYVSKACWERGRRGREGAGRGRGREGGSWDAINK